ncbi:MAG: SDR family oxidoreductase [Actinomycetota bacterium]|nr:SDR family NAD(P)-dependent oxidoreductase [Actinomycetota bacterium]
MGALDGRVAIITGAGRGLGREHALLFAAEGAKLVINDLGGSPRGEGTDRGPAQEVVDEIVALGGEAVAHTESCADWDAAERLVQLALDTFGDLHVLVNNAGILRDKMLVNMGPDEWDAVMNVHLRGHFAPTRHAASYWREQAKNGVEVKAAIVNTSSGAGLIGNVGQANYGAAKAGIAAMTVIEAIELARYGVRANAIAPVARTRLTLETPGMEDMVAAPTDAAEFDKFHPGNVSPLVAYLATADCPFTGGVFHVGGGEVGLFTNWTLPERIVKDDRWTVEELREAAPRLQAGRPTIASEGLTIAETLAGFNE